MNHMSDKPTFENLRRRSFSELKAMMDTCAPVDPAELVGWEWRGANQYPHPLATFIAWIVNSRRFAKGFFRFKGESDVYGYNIDIVPSKDDMAPWADRIVNGKPLRRRFFRVHPPGQGKRKGKHQQVAFLDYSEARPVVSGLFDGGGLKDFLGRPDPNNPDLLLGLAYQEVGPLWSDGSAFVLERWRQHELDTNAP